MLPEMKRQEMMATAIIGVTAPKNLCETTKRKWNTVVKNTKFANEDKDVAI